MILENKLNINEQNRGEDNMNINTIILIDKNQKRKENFIEKLKEKVDFSYTKLEVIFQTIREVSNKEDYKFEAKQYIEFLDKFLTNLSKKSKKCLLDIDELSIQNANKLLQEHKNIIVIYLEKKQNEGNIISIEASNIKEVEKIITEIEKRI